MARMPAYVWDVGAALGLFLLYLELKNINLVTNEEKQLWSDYYKRQQQAQQAQQQPQKDVIASIGDAIGGLFSGVSKFANPPGLSGTGMM